jgi:uncharacterized protein
VSPDVATGRIRSITALPAPEGAAPHTPAAVPLADRHDLTSAPVPEQWIREGQPVARNKCVASSTDGTAATYVWECTAGCFNWFYSVDETIYVQAGSVTVSDGIHRHVLNAGDIFFFPCGSKFEWTIDKYVRKIAFIHVPQSRKVRLVLRAFHVLRNPLRLFRGKR